MQTCLECGCPLMDAPDEKPADDRLIEGAERVCYVCYELYWAIACRRWWKLMQETWKAEQEHKKRLIRGNKD